MMRRPLAVVGVLAALVAGAGVAAIAGSALIVYVPYAAIGAFLVIRRPDNPIGWLLTATGWGFALAWLPVDATAEALTSLTAPPLVLATAWFKWWWSLPLTLTLIAALAITFPSGHLPRTRWRRPTQLLLGAMVLLTIVAAIWPAQEIVPGGGDAPFWMRNPLGLAPAGSWSTSSIAPAAVVAPVMFAMLFVAIGSMLVRYGRSGGIERLQLRWLVAGLGSIVLAIPLGFLLVAVFGADFAFTWLPAIIAFALPPIAIGVAVTRYRLYEIDRIISRTVSWTLVTGVLAMAFAATVVALQGLLEGFTQGETLAVAASTLVAFGLFQPVRRRVQRTVDRRFDRAGYDGQKVVDSFARQLRDEVDLDRLRTALVDKADVVVRPVSASIWLRGGRA